jgi:hypothetical protein
MLEKNCSYCGSFVGDCTKIYNGVKDDTVYRGGWCWHPIGTVKVCEEVGYG